MTGHGGPYGGPEPGGPYRGPGPGGPYRGPGPGGPYRGPGPGAPRFAGPPPSAPHGNWFTRGGWYFLVHLVTFGFLAALPLAHAAARIRRLWAWVVAAVSVVTMVGLLVVLGAAPLDAKGEPTGAVYNIGGGLYFLWFLAMFGVLAYLRSRAYGRSRSGGAGQYDPAVALVLEGRKRRAEARKLAATDPMLARELRIGRPDLQPEYDDGGLVDLNTAPPYTIVRVCALTPTHAMAIVQAREAAGRFAAVEDVFAWAELPVETWDVIRDRGIVVG